MSRDQGPQGELYTQNGGQQIDTHQEPDPLHDWIEACAVVAALAGATYLVVSFVLELICFFH